MCGNLLKRVFIGEESDLEENLDTVQCKELIEIKRQVRLLKVTCLRLHPQSVTDWKNRIPTSESPHTHSTGIHGAPTGLRGKHLLNLSLLFPLPYLRKRFSPKFKNSYLWKIHREHQWCCVIIRKARIYYFSVLFRFYFYFSIFNYVPSRGASD